MTCRIIDAVHVNGRFARSQEGASFITFQNALPDKPISRAFRARRKGWSGKTTSASLFCTVGRPTQQGVAARRTCVPCLPREARPRYASTSSKWKRRNAKMRRTISRDASVSSTMSKA